MTDQVAEQNPQSNEQNQFFPPTVNLFVLTSGAYLIAETHVQVTPHGQEIITLKNPCAIQEHIKEDGRVDVAFTPVAAVAENNAMQLSGNAIAMTGVPDRNFMNAYVERFQEKSPIITPPEKKLLVPG